MRCSGLSAVGGSSIGRLELAPRQGLGGDRRRAELLHSRVAIVGHVEVTFRVCTHTQGVIELCRPTTARSHDSNKSAIGCEFLNPVLKLVGHVDVSGSADCNVAQCLKLPRSRTLAPELKQEMSVQIENLDAVIRPAVGGIDAS